jgi:hypothetical protein
MLLADIKQHVERAMPAGHQGCLGQVVVHIVQLHGSGISSNRCLVRAYFLCCFFQSRPAAQHTLDVQLAWRCGNGSFATRIVSST